MNRALLFLLVRSVRGRVVRAARLLRQPKYLIGLAGFVLWVGSWMGTSVLRGIREVAEDGSIEVHFGAGELMTRLPEDALAPLLYALAVLLAVFVSLWWLAPWARMTLGLKEAEIELLLCAPVPRRQFIQYALLKNQPGILFGATMMTLFVGSGGLALRARWLVAYWLFFSIWDLHGKGRSLFKSRLKELPPARATWIRAGQGALIAAFLVVLFSALIDWATPLLSITLPDLEGDVRPFIVELLETQGARLQQGVLPWVLAPFLWTTAPFFALMRQGVGLPASFVASLPIPLVLLVIHNEWVVRSQVKFEEAALEHARREVAKKDPRSRYWKISPSRRRQAPFPLRPTGSPEMAVLWKNMFLVRRGSLARNLSIGAVAAAVIGVTPPLLGAPAWVSMAVASVGMALVAAAPMIAPMHPRNDLRTDLTKLELIRPWPLSAWKLFAVEVLSPATEGVVWALSGSALALAADAGARLAYLLGGTRTNEEIGLVSAGLAEFLGAPGILVLPLAVLGTLPLVVAVACVTAAIQNLAVLLFPGWVHLGVRHPQGPAAFGQNMVVFLGISISILLSLLPSALLVGALVLGQVFLLGVPVVAWELPVLGLVAATPTFTAAYLLTLAGGRLWEHLDPSREILERAA